MPDNEHTKSSAEFPTLKSSTLEPLVFISHDTRDADLAEAFSKLLRSVSAGMLKTFRSSDRKGTEGIEFGDEWYKRLMDKLEVASDVVCLLTQRSLDRPWLLYEAGVAKGKLNTPVHGIALGVPLSRVTNGPFYQFQNADDGKESLTKLVLQLARRVPGLEPDAEVVSTQVTSFKTKADEILASLADPGAENSSEQTSAAKLFEEIKVLVRELPSELGERLNSTADLRPRRRRIHPGMLEELGRLRTDSRTPIGLLIVLSLVKEDLPWIYEMGYELFTALRGRSHDRVRRAMSSFWRAVEITLESRIIEHLVSSRELFAVVHELPRLVERIVAEQMSRGPATPDDASEPDGDDEKSTDSL